MGSFTTDIKFVSPPTRVLHPSASGVDLTLTGDLTVGDDGIFSGGVTVGNTDPALTGQIKLAASGGAGYLSFYDGAYREGHIDASTLYLDISGTAKGTASATVFSYVNITTPGTLTAAAGTVSGALGIAGAATVGGTATMAAGSVTTAFVVTGTATLGAGTVTGAFGVAGALSTSGTVTAAAGTVSGNLSAGGTVIAAAGTVSGALGVGGTVTAAGVSIGPLFSYLRSATVNNVTGNGTVYTCVFDTAVISNANFATGTGIFTAPAAGKYLLMASISMVAGNSSGTQGSVQIVTTGQSFRLDLNPYGSRHTSSGVTTVALAVIASLATNDTAKVTLTITGSGSDNGSFVGGSGFSSFAGWRVG